MTEENTMEFHPVSEIFPLMEGEEFRQLVEDIRDHGLREPISLHPDGRIIDGRNRYRACQETGAYPLTRTWNGVGSLVEFVVSLNLRRRHLTSSQRAAAAAEALDQLKVEAKERQREGGRTKVVQEIAQAGPMAGRAVEQAAKTFGTNRTYVSEAAKLKEQDPDLFAAVKAGEITLSQRSEISEVLWKPAEMRERVTPLGLGAKDLLMLVSLDKRARRSWAVGHDSLIRALDLFEADEGTTLKDAVTQVRGEINANEKQRTQQIERKREEQESRFAEEEEQRWRELDPFEHFAGWLLDDPSYWDGPDGRSGKLYEVLLRHIKNCGLDKLGAAVEGEWARFLANPDGLVPLPEDPQIDIDEAIAKCKPKETEGDGDPDVDVPKFMRRT